MPRSYHKMKVRYFMKARRILMSLGGVIICAVSVGGFKYAALGVDPFQSLMSGLDAITPIRFGTLYVVANAILLCFTLVADRKNIGLATFINLFLLGYITEFTLGLLQIWMPEPTLWLRWAFLMAAIVVICFGSSLYMTANLGVSTYDAVAIVLSGKWKLGKFKFVRIACDLVCVIIGCTLFLMAGGNWQQLPTIAGIGTIITAFFMGPLIDYFNKAVAVKLLNEHKILKQE